MKKAILSFVAIISFLISVNGQNSIKMHVNHYLADAAFALGEGAQNNMGHDFNVDRLQYYMSGFSLIHDGGTETVLGSDFHVLISAQKAAEVDLGVHEVTNLESIRFHIGVHPDYNHEDPSVYEAGHPLAPFFPSMHWGWVAGYRFIAMEGSGGSSFNQTYQLHGLGDDNYFGTEVQLGLTAVDGEIIIEIDADYTRILEDIAVNSGVIVHGDFGEAKQALENFRDYVFSSGTIASSTVDFSEVTQFEVFPNPSKGDASVAFSTTQDLDYQVTVTNTLGQEVQTFNAVKANANLPFQVNQSGVYMISLIKEGQVVIQKKLVVQ